MSYAPGQPVGLNLIPPQPAASETVQGLIELATTTETTTGTDDVRAVTPDPKPAAETRAAPPRLRDRGPGGGTGHDDGNHHGDG